ncbi:hypothetical protein NUU61_008579 [Penicillium alfredii]|uniref:VOC domain-containing protein n=1 Tax=Penicillium alfredii TaxID=1506179 RepID=A0A9W9JWG1_9EURO|nr:uncharacterized protein NUU61_008579 [Penicillium alfredii]KAJ5084000.1 hypothetical protein NUU61_008579 [Penicillium alfredii]
MPPDPGVFQPGGPKSLNAPPTPPTSNYRLNHLALRIKDPARSLRFYIELLGMRMVFSMNAGPFTIYYLGHPPPNTSDVEEWARTTSEIPALTRTSGLLELYHVHGTERVYSQQPDSKSQAQVDAEAGDAEDAEKGEGGGGENQIHISNGNQPPHLGFAHLGFTVPDIRDALERLRAAGVPILKDLGMCSRETAGLSRWEEERGVGRGEIHTNYAWFFEKFAMVADPDGYSIELIPQNI